VIGREHFTDGNTHWRTLSMTTMTALQPVQAGLPSPDSSPTSDNRYDNRLPATPHAEIEEFVRLATAASSRHGYQADFGYFSAWCEAQGLMAMPASPQNVARYLAHCARQKLRPATIAKRAAAIRYAHQLARLPTSTDSTEVRLGAEGDQAGPDQEATRGARGHDGASGASAAEDLWRRYEGQA
jgi:hypothetical protein